jgi:hypothetical protein
MRNGRGPVKVMLVNRTQSIDIRCEIDSFGNSFRGELTDEQGKTRSFSGWTEFATALTALVRVTDAPTNQANQEETSP